MTAKWETSRAWPRRRGLTLIEVVVGLGLLATLLASILLAYGRHVHQIRRAQRRLDAVEAVDGLLRQWFSQSAATLPETGGGRLGDKSLAWRVARRGNSEVKGIGADVMRLEVFDMQARDATLTDAVRRPLLVVDFLRPRPEQAAPDGNQAAPDGNADETPQNDRTP